jgi:hypothetical protein
VTALKGIRNVLKKAVLPGNFRLVFNNISQQIILQNIKSMIIISDIQITITGANIIGPATGIE